MAKSIFISSTYEDLKEYRKSVWSVLEIYDVNIRGMERFGARKEGPLATCLAEVEQADIFVCIIGYKLGSVDGNTSKSFVQLEYERAFELNKEILIYFFDEKEGVIKTGQIDFGENHEKLQAFKDLLKERHTIDVFTSQADLSEKLKRRFDEFFSKKITDQPANEDEFEKARKILFKFLQLPKEFSNREVRLRIKIDGAAFSASKAICKAFLLSYGRTLGFKVKIIKPVVTEDVYNYLFIEGELAEQFLDFKPKDEIDIYAYPNFAEETIDTIQAHFVSKTQATQNIFTSLVIQPDFFAKSEKLAAEGQIILLLKEIIKNTGTGSVTAHEEKII